MMKVKEAISILSQATQPAVALTRANYVQIEAALACLAELIEAQEPEPDGEGLPPE
jgi:hypothetical protein